MRERRRVVHHVVAVLPEHPLVDKREDSDRRLVLVGAPGEGVHVVQELLRPAAPVGVGRVVEEDLRLEEREARFALRVEVRRNQDAAPRARRDEPVELRNALRREGEAVGRTLQQPLGVVVVVEADGVVAVARHAVEKPFGLLVALREAQFPDEVHAGEADFPPRRLLPLEVVPGDLEPAPAARRRNQAEHSREVERRPGRNVLPMVDRHPVRTFRDDERAGPHGAERRIRGGQRRRESHALPGAELPGARKAQRKRPAVAGAGIVQGDLCRFVERERVATAA